MVFKAQVAVYSTSSSGRLNGDSYVFHFLLFPRGSDRQSLKNKSNNHRKF
jgi:hypothetical protein